MQKKYNVSSIVYIDADKLQPVPMDEWLHANLASAENSAPRSQVLCKYIPPIVYNPQLDS